MKKLIFTLIAAVATFAASATILSVRENGVYNSYPFPQQAVNSASEGDTIVFYPRAGGVNWGAISLRKSLYLMSNDDTVKAKLGTIEVVGDQNKSFVFENLSISGMTFTANTANVANPTRITLSHCSIGSTSTSTSEAVVLEMYYCDLGSFLYCSRAKIIGCVFGGYPGSTYTQLQMFQSTSANTNDTTYFVGNRGTLYGQSTTSASNITVCRPLIFTNNSISLSTSFTNYLIFKFTTRHDTINDNWVFANNTVSNITSTSSFYWSIETTNGTRKDGAMWMVNNLFVNNSALTGCFYASVTYSTHLVISNNLLVNGSWNNSYVSANFSRTGTIGTVADAYGRGIDSTTINRGVSLPEYSDIDLTQNDIGTYGGPYSIDNFLTSNGKARVGFLLLPRKVATPSTPVYIRAKGVSKW